VPISSYIYQDKVNFSPHKYNKKNGQVPLQLSNLSQQTPR
jgi:hypothetical protein